MGASLSTSCCSQQDAARSHEMKDLHAESAMLVNHNDSSPSKIKEEADEVLRLAALEAEAKLAKRVAEEEEAQRLKEEEEEEKKLREEEEKQAKDEEERKAAEQAELEAKNKKEADQKKKAAAKKEKEKKAKAEAEKKTTAEAEAKAKAVPPSPVIVHIVRARGLRNADWFGGKSDCFCTFGANNKNIYKTKVINDCLEPVWLEEEEIKERNAGEALTFEVWDKDIGKPDDLLGKATLAAVNFEKEGYVGELRLDTAGKGITAFIKIKVALPGRRAPADPSPEYEVALEKAAGHSLGLILDGTNKAFGRISSITPDSTVAKHNARASADKKIREGDFIMGVDTITGKFAQMDKALQKDGKHVLQLIRACFFSIVIPKKAGSLSMSLAYGKTGSAIFVKDVKEGPVADWNKANKDKAVKANDWFVSVNGFRSTGEEMYAKLKGDDQFQLVVSRPAVTPFEQSHVFAW